MEEGLGGGERRRNEDHKRAGNKPICRNPIKSNPRNGYSHISELRLYEAIGYARAELSVSRRYPLAGRKQTVPA